MDTRFDHRIQIQPNMHVIFTSFFITFNPTEKVSTHARSTFQTMAQK
jgi:hypothetical protein